MEPQPTYREDETLDGIPGGSLRIIQKRKGYRFSLDALLLAHFAGLCEGERVVDLGCGNGIVALIVAGRGGCTQAVGIDIQEACVALARRNARLNGLEERTAFLCADLRRPEALPPPASCDCAVFNPPYRRLRSGRMNPTEEKALARHEIAGSAADFLTAAARLLKAKGRAVAIYPASRIVELLTRMRQAHLEPKRLRIVHTRSGGRGEFALVEGLQGGREALAVGPPLFIYEEGGGYTEEMETIFRALAVSEASGGGRSPRS